MSKTPKVTFLPGEDVFLHSLNRLQEAKEFLEQPLFVSSAINEPRKKTRNI